MKQRRVLGRREAVTAAERQGWKSRPQADGNLWKIGLNQTGVPKANSSVMRRTWTGITPCNLLRLHLLESSSSLGNQALFQCFSVLRATCLGKPGAPLCFHFPYCKLSLKPSL